MSKSARVTVRLEPEDKESFQKLAKQLHTPVSALLRYWITDLALRKEVRQDEEGR